MKKNHSAYQTIDCIQRTIIINMKICSESVIDSDTFKGCVHSGFELVKFSLLFSAWNDWT